MIPRRLRFFVGIAVTALAAASYGALSLLRGGGRVRRFAYNIEAFSVADYGALAARPGWRAIELDVGEGLRLRGLERVASGGSAPCILFLTGNEAHPLREGQRFIDALRGEHDWGGVVWAYRGFDGSAGTPSAESLESDAWEQYQRLSSQSTGPLHLVGFSLGTGIVASLAARATARGAPPASVTLLAPYTEIDMQLAGSGVRHRYQTLEYLRGWTAPTLIVHGAHDDVLPVEGARLLATRLGEIARYVELADLKHLDLPASPAAIDEARAFIESH